MEDGQMTNDPEREPPCPGEWPTEKRIARSRALAIAPRRRGFPRGRRWRVRSGVHFRRLGSGMHTVGVRTCKNLASICYRGQRYQEACRLHGQVPEHLALRARSTVAACLVAGQLERFGEAEHELNRFLEVFPSDAEVLAALLFCFFGLQGRSSNCLPTRRGYRWRCSVVLERSFAR